jgi:hypothetical protein
MYIVHFVSILLQIWPPQAIHVFDWPIPNKMFSSETTWPTEEKFGMNYLWNLLYKYSSFRPDPLTNMVATGNSFFYQSISKKNLSSETAKPNEPTLLMKHIWKVLYKDCSICSDPLTDMIAIANSCF